MWDYSPAQCTLCAFRAPSLDYRGNSCSQIVCVLPAPAGSLQASSNCRRRDVFVLCDFRKIAYSLRFVNSNVHVLHLPSIAATFGYGLEACRRLAVTGSQGAGEEVTVDGHAALTFAAEIGPDYAETVAASPADGFGAAYSEDEDDVPTHEAARLWPSAVEARGLEATRNTIRRLARQRSRSRSGQRSPTSSVDGLQAFPSKLVGPLIWPSSFEKRQIDTVCGGEDWRPPSAVAATFPTFAVSASRGPTAISLKLLQEPASRSLQERECLEQAREFTEGEGRSWPFVPAGSCRSGAQS